MSINTISQPLPGERVVALSPEDTTAAATDWPRRPNLYPGRALTDLTLQGRQRWQAGHIAVRGQAFTPGVTQGLETAYQAESLDEGGTRVRLLIEAGQGLAVSGEDVVLARRVECLLADLPVVAPPAWFVVAEGEGEGTASDSTGGAPHPRSVGGRLADVLATAGSRMPDVGVLVLQPVTVDVSDFDPNDPCDRCPCTDQDNLEAFEDWRVGDGARLLWYPWPVEWRPLPTTRLRRRNALAHLIFEAEAQLAHGQALPWEEWGVPIALLGLDVSGTAPGVRFIDRAAVVRQGGRAREARLMLAGGGAPVTLAANSRLPALWQARMEQFAEQLVEQETEVGGPPPDPRVMADPFLKLPPCGLLPRNALRLADFRSDFFPAFYTLDAVPVPLEQLDLAIREAAPLAPLDLALPERLRLLVPVSQASWEPRLLHQEVIDPEFQQTMDRFLLTRSRELGIRQGLRNESALLARALTGQTQAVPTFNDDPLAVEQESLAPWGPPPEGGGHLSAARAGVHQHYFDSASTPFPVAAGESLFAWVQLDPDNPPRALMLQWHANGTWEHRAYWGEDLIAWGAAGSAAHRYLGDLPEAGGWARLEVPAASLGLAGGNVDGLAFTLYDGRAAYGLTGARDANGERKWFCNVLPAGARLQGDEPWELLSHNGLWAPFAAARAVALGRPQARPGGDGGHLEPAQAGTHQHYFINGAAFAVAASETLYAWVYIDPNDPPREVMLQWRVGSSWEHRAYWGFDSIAWGTANSNSRRRAGSLPRPGEWVRLEVAADQVGLAGQSVHGMAFTLFGGAAAFAGAGAFAGTGAERQWFAGGLPAGAQPTGIWNWLDADSLLAPTASNRIGVVEGVSDLYDDPALVVLSGQEKAQLALRGLDGFVAYLRARIDRADDLTDYSFVKLQTDIYRVRQLMLGGTDATRLAVSPALAAIAKAETAVASQAQISSYLSEVKQTTAARSAQPRAFTMGMMFDAGGIIGGASSSAAKSEVRTVAKAVEVQATYTPIYKAATYSPAEVVLSSPLIGKTSIRTTAIAERLRDPPSKEARDYALATRQEAMNAVLRLVDDLMAEDGGIMPGLFAGLDIHGMRDDPFLETVGSASRRRKLEDFVANRNLLNLLVQSPTTLASANATAPDEGTLFSEVADVSDNTVALLRQIEGRVKRYRDALTVCETALAQLRDDYSGTLARVSATGQRLAEARHDVAVARALMAEEQARIDAVNDRRAKVLDEEVRFLAFARPRQTSIVAPAPYRVVDPALEEAPVPACLGDHPDVPDELEDMLRVAREAPASWFIRTPILFDRLDRADLLLRTLKSAQQRLPQLLARPAVAQPVASTLGKAVTQVISRQTALLAGRASAAASLDASRLAVASWQNIRDQVREVVSLGDLIDGEHGKGLVARQAAAEFDRIASICACLHTEFCGVSAAIRLDWAEAMGQFDAAPNLRNLANLPRWSEIDSTDRRQMQAYADWLFSQVQAGQSQAVALINDVVRMCLLLASHAPVGRIVAGRLPRPVTAVRPGIRIPLVALEPAKARVGMQAVIYRAQQVVARAVVEDVGSEEVSARVLYTHAAQIDLDMDVRVHFDQAEVVSAAPKRTSGIFKR